ncbi:MAG: helix-turn-helix domain-containing protein [Clostridium sp.]
MDTNNVHEQCHMKERCEKYETCPMILVNRLLSGKWKILILWYLSDTTLRFSQLKNKLPDITQKMLTQQLRSLEEDKLISRKIFPIVPPKVEYSLTNAGMSIIPILEMMYTFGVDYSKNKE